MDEESSIPKLRNRKIKEATDSEKGLSDRDRVVSGLPMRLIRIVWWLVRLPWNLMVFLERNAPYKKTDGDYSVENNNIHGVLKVASALMRLDPTNRVWMKIKRWMTYAMVILLLLLSAWYLSKTIDILPDIPEPEAIHRIPEDFREKNETTEEIKERELPDPRTEMAEGRTILEWDAGLLDTVTVDRYDDLEQFSADLKACNDDCDGSYSVHEGYWKLYQNDTHTTFLDVTRMARRQLEILVEESAWLNFVCGSMMGIQDLPCACTVKRKDGSFDLLLCPELVYESKDRYRILETLSVVRGGDADRDARRTFSREIPGEIRIRNNLLPTAEPKNETHEILTVMGSDVNTMMRAMEFIRGST